MKKYLAILVGIIAFHPLFSMADEPKDRQFTVSHSIMKEGSTKTIVSAGYLIYYPENYEIDIHEKFPVVLHLHGAGENGTDIDVLRSKTTQLPGLVHKGNYNYPFIIVSPLAKSSMDALGNYDYLEQIMAHVRDNNRIDTSREYVAGLSQGGKAARKYAERNTETIAGLISASGYSGGTNIEGLVAGEVPIILSHNEDDTVISINSSNGYYKKLVAAGATRIIYDIEETGGHGSWGRIYKNMDYWDWLFSFSNDLDGIEISEVSFSPTTLTAESTQLKLSIKVIDNLGDDQGIESVQVDFSSILGNIVNMSTNDNQYFDITYDINNALTVGVYPIKVTVLDKEGNTKDVDYEVSVLEPHNEAPLVSIVQPLANSTYDSATEINMLVDASDSDGEITKVEFYADGTLIGSDTEYPYELFDVNSLTPGEHTLSAKAYDDSGQHTQTSDVNITIESVTIPYTEGTTVLAIQGAGKAEGSSYFPMEKAFDSQPTYSEFGLSDVDGGDRAPAYSNRYGYIDFGENWEKVRIAQTWTLYRASSAGDHTPYTQVWWDDDIDTVNDSNQDEMNINFNTAENLAYSSAMTWALDNDMTDNPITPLNRYLLLKSPDSMTYRASEYAFVGWIEVDAPPLSIMISNIHSEDIFKTGKYIEIAIEAINADNITRVEYFANNELLTTSSLAPFNDSIIMNQVGEYEVYAIAYEGSEEGTKSESITIHVEQSLDIITPTDAGKADGSQYFPMDFAFDSQPTTLDSGFSEVDGGNKAPYYKSRVGYIDFGENWEGVVIAQTYTLYRPSSAGAHTPYTEVWWDDDKDIVNDGVTETQINFNTETNLSYQVYPQWVQDKDFSDAPITAKGRYLMLRSPENMTERALEYVLLGSKL